MRKSHLRQAVTLMARTRPFFLARLAVYGVFFFATAGYTASFVLLLRVYSQSAVAQLIILAFAAGLYLLGRRYLSRQLTYSGHAPHIQAMIEALKGNALPKGSAQIEAATRQVDDHFPETTRLFQLESLVGRVLREARHIVIEPGALRPLPGFQKLGRVGALIGWVALKNMRNAVFGYTLWLAKPNLWKSAKRGLALYAQGAAALTTSAIRVFLTGVLFGLVLIGLALWPGWSLINWGLDQSVFMFAAVVVGFAKAVWVVKTALYDPLGLAWMLSVFVRHAEATTTVDPEWANKLAKASKRFRELSELAEGADKAAARTKAAEAKAGESGGGGGPKAGESGGGGGPKDGESGGGGGPKDGESGGGGGPKDAPGPGAGPGGGEGDDKIVVDLDD